ncbi:MAG TPA: PadR family transcriptional regulator [Candidatus Dormibacteraeota bacterium]|nr:PadR family transcriptional regulator [Candidatus Dormibacteraeota bacterium]
MKHMAEQEPEVSSPLALSILELLDERPMHPYEMASTMRARHHDEFIRLNFGTLYHTVDVLERRGWILPGEREKEGRRPERTVYKLTDAGREVLTRTLGELLRKPSREYPQFVAGLMFMHHLDSRMAASHLNERASLLDAQIAKFEHVLAELHRQGLSRLALIEMEHKIAMLDAERKWVRKLEGEIKDGRLEWKVGIDAGHETLRRRHGASTH